MVTIYLCYLQAETNIENAEKPIHFINNISFFV